MKSIGGRIRRELSLRKRDAKRRAEVSDFRRRWNEMLEPFYYDLLDIESERLRKLVGRSRDKGVDGDA